MHVVLANKRPLTTHRKLYDELRALADERGRRLLHETTVGAGLPIIDTFYKLAESGDRVSKIEGCPSGTLGFLFGEMGRGRPFSDALRRAIAKGYPEPDPREDLSGTDVARKALILGRLLGFPGEMGDIEVESLVPPEGETPAAEGVPGAARGVRCRVATARAAGARARRRAALPLHRDPAAHSRRPRGGGLPPARSPRSTAPTTSSFSRPSATRRIRW